MQLCLSLFFCGRFSGSFGCGSGSFFAFGNHGERNFHADFLVELHHGGVRTYFLHVLNGNDLAVDFEAALSQFFGDVQVVYRT